MTLFSGKLALTSGQCKHAWSTTGSKIREKLVQNLSSQSFTQGPGGDVGEGFAAGALVAGGGGRQHEGDSRQHRLQPGQEEGDL